MPEKPLPIEQVLTMLAEAPQRIAAFTDGLAPEQLRIAPHEGEWSANDVLAHLRSCADVWGDCIAAMLAEDRPTLKAVNPRTWIKHTDYPDLEFGPSLQAYTRQRAGLISLLESLRPEGWARRATVTGAGRTLDRSVRFYAQWLATHERPHIKQIAGIARAMRR
ncbi:MAG: DinB family protein [Chloroflexota bacterium]|nr:DinB family protein [Chloroflexota bacterium]